MMAYVPGCQHDIFISYAWVDNDPIIGIKIGWVSHLVDSLKKIIAQSIGRTDLIKLWMDRRDETAGITQDILDAAQSSAILLIILSPGYLASDWCRKERNLFLRQLRTKFNGNKRQIFIIEKTSYRVKRPRSLNDVISIPFWYEDEDDNIHTMDLPRYNPEEVDYYIRLQKIVYRVIDVLERLKKGSRDNGKS